MKIPFNKSFMKEKTLGKIQELEESLRLLQKQYDKLYDELKSYQEKIKRFIERLKELPTDKVFDTATTRGRDIFYNEIDKLSKEEFGERK